VRLEIPLFFQDGKIVLIQSAALVRIGTT